MLKALIDVARRCSENFTRNLKADMAMLIPPETLLSQRSRRSRRPEPPTSEASDPGCNIGSDHGED